MSSIAGIDDLSKLSDSIAAHMTMKLGEKQKVLELKTLSKLSSYTLRTFLWFPIRGLSYLSWKSISRLILDGFI